MIEMDIITLLIESSLIFATLFAGVWLLKTIFKKHLTAKLQYLIWSIVIIKLLIPVSITTEWSPYTVMQNMQDNAPLAEEQIAVSNENDIVPGFQKPNENAAIENQTDKAKITGGGNTKAPLINTSPSAKPIQIDWKAMILYLWLTGFIACTAWFLHKTWRLKKKIKRCETQKAPVWLCAQIETCKHELDISHKIQIVVQGALTVPAIMGIFKPVLIIPERLIRERNLQKVQHVVMHELMHYKRKDLLAIWGLNILSAVYWFNPLVWLCFMLIRRDMEAACDSMVVDALGKKQRKGYIQTILHFSGKQENTRIQAAMSLNDGCMKIQHRIMSMFMRKKADTRVKVTVLGLALMMIFAAFTAGCQPTPEKPFVQSKDNDSVQQAIQDSAQETKIHTYSAPETWQLQAHDEVKNIDLFVDADVNVPADTWGIYELKPFEPTLEDAREILDAVTGDVAIYGEYTLRSKEYLMEQITSLESRKAEFERQLNEGGLSEDEKLAQEAQEQGGESPHSISKLTEEDLQKNIDIFANMINEEKAALPTAPDEDTVVQNEFFLEDMFKKDMTAERARQSGFTYQQEGNYVTMSLRGTADLGRDTPADISLWLGIGDYNRFNMRFTDYDDYEQSFTSGESYTGQELYKCDISMEEAAETAREKVSEMGFGYLDIETTQVCGMLDRQRKEGDRFPECFKFVFTRSMDGATATFAHGDGAMTLEKELALEYAPYWDAGEITVHVDDSGVIGINVNTVRSDAVRQAYGIELKDFEEIMDIFETQVFIENAYGGPGDADKVVKREIRVKEIRLGYMPTAWKDHSGKIIFTPVWDFFGEEIITFEDGIKGDLGEALDNNSQYYRDLGVESLLTINALDGTIMLRL